MINIHEINIIIIQHYTTVVLLYYNFILICTYYRSSSDFHHPIKCTPTYCEPFRSTRKVIIAERKPTTAPSCFFTTICLSFTGRYHRSSYTCSQPATGYTAHLINCTSVQPCPTTTCSSFSSVCLPTSPLFEFARRPTALLVLQPYLTSTQTYIYLNKLPPAYITSTARSRQSPTLSLFTATLLLCWDIQPNPGPTHPANLLICTVNTRSMLTPEHVTALNDLTDNHKPDIIALIETWICSYNTCRANRLHTSWLLSFLCSPFPHRQPL